MLGTPASLYKNATTNDDLSRRQFVSLTAGRSSGSSPPTSINTGGDAGIPEDKLNYEALKSGETKTSSSITEPPHSKQPTS
jgi:hypothetical protein